MKHSRTLLALSATMGAALLLAGCSGPGPDGADDEDSPLTVYLNAMYGGDLSEEEQEAKFAGDQKQREELIAQCMTEQGFEYTPDTQSATWFSSSGEEWKPDEREWVSQYGYGAIDYPGRDEPVAPDQEWQDPNADYLEALSESEQTAYYEALYGPGPDEEEIAEDGSYEYDWETSGCQGSADHEVSGADPLQSDEFKPLMDAMNEMWMAQPTWPGMSELDAEWAACMDEGGQPGFTLQSEAVQSIYDELNAMYEQADPEQFVEPDGAAMTALQEKEVALALVDLDCREDTDYRERAKKAQWTAEEAFIADHKADLDAAKAAAEQAKS